MRVFLKIEYDGTNYCGWQIQPNGNTVQAEIVKAIETLTGESVNLVGSGRTDAGVHAVGQVAHFDTQASVPPEKFKQALNTILPDDIKISESGMAKENFHARYSAKKKTYIYRLYESDHTHPLKDRYAVRVAGPLNVKKMNDGAKLLVGEKDFRCFLASDSAVKDTVRKIYFAEVSENGEDIEFKIIGNGFLYNMVRIIVGTLVKIGEGKIPPEEMTEIIESGKRDLAGMTMPPRGLVLYEVEYD